MGFGAVRIGGKNGDDALFVVVARSLKDLQWRHGCFDMGFAATSSGLKKETTEGAELQSCREEEEKKKR